MPYCFLRSSIKFQGHTGWKTDDLNPIWIRLVGRSQLSNPSDSPCCILIWAVQFVNAMTPDPIWVVWRQANYSDVVACVMFSCLRAVIVPQDGWYVWRGPGGGHGGLDRHQLGCTLTTDHADTLQPQTEDSKRQPARGSWYGTSVILGPHQGLYSLRRRCLVSIGIPL